MPFVTYSAAELSVLGDLKRNTSKLFEQGKDTKSQAASRTNSVNKMKGVCESLMRLVEVLPAEKISELVVGVGQLALDKMGELQNVAEETRKSYDASGLYVDTEFEEAGKTHKKRVVANINDAPIAVPVGTSAEVGQDRAPTATKTTASVDDGPEASSEQYQSAVASKGDGLADTTAAESVAVCPTTETTSTTEHATETTVDPLQKLRAAFKQTKVDIRIYEPVDKANDSDHPLTRQVGPITEMSLSNILNSKVLNTMIGKHLRFEGGKRWNKAKDPDTESLQFYVERPWTDPMKIRDETLNDSKDRWINVTKDLDNWVHGCCVRAITDASGKVKRSLLGETVKIIVAKQA